MIRRLPRSILLLAGLLLLLSHASPARAHEIRPALLEITETNEGWYDVVWKVPMVGDMILVIDPVLPPGLKAFGPPTEKLVPGALIRRYTFTGDGGTLAGQRITIDGLSVLQIDVLLRVSLANGSVHTTIIRPSSPSYVIPERATKMDVAWSYTRMGFEHILDGIDHLLFLLAMMLLVTGFWRLLKTITAFTVAHSITLALATLGLVNVPSAPTEAIIALSIVFVAGEVFRKRRGLDSLAQRSPWILAFLFGLFHGLGFAGALTEIGVPAHEVPLSLLMFNVGVELGQILFVCAVFGVLLALRRIKVPAIRRPALRYACAMVPVYVIGGLAAFWTIQRVLSFFPVSA